MTSLVLHTIELETKTESSSAKWERTCVLCHHGQRTRRQLESCEVNYSNRYCSIVVVSKHYRVILVCSVGFGETKHQN